MNLQYITDIQGHINSVMLPVNEWEQIKKDLEELAQLRKKNNFLSELAMAVEEMKLIKEGKIEVRNAEDFLNEL